MGHVVIDAMADYLEALPSRAPWTPVPPARQELLASQPLPERGRRFEDLLGFVVENVLPHPFGNGHPRFFAWGNPAPALEGVLGELVANVMNPSCAGGDQASVHVERCAVRWLAELVGFPGDGVLVSGGAAGALTAIAAARHRAAMQDGWDDRVVGFSDPSARRFRLYASDQTHSCQRKAARLLGIGDQGVRLVSTDALGRMDVMALADAIATDRARGLRPFCVVANAGVVGTGVVDPLALVAEVCEQEHVWFHVDGSLGGFGVLDARVRQLFEGLDRADSLVLDPHKWLSVPIDCAVILVRNMNDLRETFSLVPSYLRARPDDLPWFSEYVFDQTRPFRALKLWATIAGVGRRGLIERIRRNNDQARRLAGHIQDSPELELIGPPELNVVAFRWRDGDDTMNRVIPLRVQEAGDVFLTGMQLHGREAIRACIMGYATDDSDIDRIVPAVASAARALANE